MTTQILPDPDHPSRWMVCSRGVTGSVVGARLAKGTIPIPDGPVRNLSHTEAAQQAARWDAFLRRQERIT